MCWYVCWFSNIHPKLCSGLLREDSIIKTHTYLKKLCFYKPNNWKECVNTLFLIWEKVRSEVTPSCTPCPTRASARGHCFPHCRKWLTVFWSVFLKRNKSACKTFLVWTRSFLHHTNLFNPHVILNTSVWILLPHQKQALMEWAHNHSIGGSFLRPEASLWWPTAHCCSTEAVSKH